MPPTHRWVGAVAQRSAHAFSSPAARCDECELGFNGEGTVTSSTATKRMLPRHTKIVAADREISPRGRRRAAPGGSARSTSAPGIAALTVPPPRHEK